MTQQIPTIILAAASVGLNVALATAIYLLKLPIYLDSIGIMLTAILAPGTRFQAFVAASIVGAVSFLIGGLLINPFLPWYIGTAVGGAGFGAYVVRGRVNSVIFSEPTAASIVKQSLLYGVGWGVIAALISAPVTVYLFGGVTGSGVTLITVFLLKLGQQLVNAVVLTGLAAEPVDKTLQMFCAILIARATPAAFKLHLAKHAPR